LSEVGEMALKSLGFGVKHNQNVVNYAPSVSNVFIDKDTLAKTQKAKTKMQDSLPSSSNENVLKTIEHNSTEIDLSARKFQSD